MRARRAGRARERGDALPELIDVMFGKEPHVEKWRYCCDAHDGGGRSSRGDRRNPVSYAAAAKNASTNWADMLVDAVSESLCKL